MKTRSFRPEMENLERRDVPALMFQAITAVNLFVPTPSNAVHLSSGVLRLVPLPRHGQRHALPNGRRVLQT